MFFRKRLCIFIILLTVSIIKNSRNNCTYYSTQWFEGTFAYTQSNCVTWFVQIFHSYRHYFNNVADGEFACLVQIYCIWLWFIRKTYADLNIGNPAAARLYFGATNIWEFRSSFSRACKVFYWIIATNATWQKGRRYSTELIKTAFLLHLTSNNLYKKLKTLFFFLLPLVRRLQSLSAGAYSSGSIDLAFLHEITKGLTVAIHQ